MPTTTTSPEPSRGRWKRALLGLLTAAILLPVPALALAETIQDADNAQRRQLKNFLRLQRVQLRNLPIQDIRNGAEAEFAQYQRDLWNLLNSVFRLERATGQILPPPPFSPFTFTGRYTRF